MTRTVNDLMVLERGVKGSQVVAAEVYLQMRLHLDVVFRNETVFAV